MLKDYKIRMLSRHGIYFEGTIYIPDDVYFFCNKGEVGHLLCDDCEHYCTIVETDKYEDWFNLNSEQHASILDVAYFNKIGKYTIIELKNVYKGDNIPVIDREEWFKQNNIDLNKYVIVTYNKKDFKLLNAVRIINFKSPYSIDIARVSRRDYFSQNEMYRLEYSNEEIDGIIKDKFDNFDTMEVLIGDAAEELWNSMIYQVISKVGGYNQKSVNKNFDYDVKRNKMMEVLKKYNIDNLILN